MHFIGYYILKFLEKTLGQRYSFFRPEGFTFKRLIFYSIFVMLGVGIIVFIALTLKLGVFSPSGCFGC